jgi:hypothetical protein
MKEKKIDTLPPTEWLTPILERDFSRFEPEEGDSEQILTQKLKTKKEFLDFFDFYVDKMVPTCAGTKMWHMGIRHFECLSTSKLPNKEHRVPPATEALVAVLYINARDKWVAMHKWTKAHPEHKGDPPRWSKKRPDEYVEFRALYSDPFAGQNKLGGWAKGARKLFGQLAKLVKNNRLENKERCVQVEQACVDRLFAKNKETYDKKASKKRPAKDIEQEEEEEDEDLEWVV